MKNEDFERLKDVCEKEVFGIQHFHTEETYHIWKKDIWEGVEFLKIIDGYRNPDYTGGKIYPFKGFDEGDFANCLFDDQCRPENGPHKDQCIPSTESAYIEQLKKEAFDRFGEIKEGDRFERDFEGTAYDRIFKIGEKLYPKKGFEYCKETDALMYHGHTIYRQGKWATRVKERVKVKGIGRPVWNSNDSFGYNFSFNFKVENGGENIDVFKTQDFLAQQLENYLNNEA